MRLLPVSLSLCFGKGPWKGGGCAGLLLVKERMGQACLSSGEQMGGGERRQRKGLLPAPEMWAASNFWAGCCFRCPAKVLELEAVS